jgi:outer membrane receptor protein involved in Fe transport
MRTTFLLFTFLACFAASGQGKITGTLTDSATAKPIAKLTVTLQGARTQQTVTDSLGIFTINGLSFGNYTLQLSAVGYQPKTLPVSLSQEKQSVTVNTSLTQDNTSLKAVTITANRALVEDKGDRLVYNAAADISNTGGTAADVLRKVPAVTVDLEGNVQLRGNGNIRVLVNGKPSAMMARNLADALRQMPANVIKTVEVITSPGAKYDAEGAAGIINIITKRGLRGASGSVTVTGGDRNRSLGFNLSAKTGKIGLNLSANGYQNRREYEASAVRTTLKDGLPVNILYRSNSADNIGSGGYGELAFDYDPDSTNHLNLSANVWGGDFPNGSTTWLRLTDPSGFALQDFRNESRFTNPYGNGQLDLGWTKTLKKPEQEFSVLWQFSRMPDNYFYNTDRIAANEEIIFREKSTNYSRNKEYTAQVDYTHPVQIRSQKDTSTLKIEIGTKAILRDIGSEVRVAQSLNGKDELLPDPLQTNDFDYDQRVYSGYTSLRWSNKAKWSLAAGARLEHTEIRGHFISSGTRINNQYNNLIPSLTVSKGVKTHNFKLSYTQRITRPQIWFLNPWVNRSDPKAITTGTPRLEPELNHAMEVGHSMSSKGGTMLNSALYWRLTDNAIEYVMRMDTGGISISQPQNIARRSIVGINMNLSAKPNKDWNLNGGADLRYIEVVAPAQQNSGWMWNFNTNTTYKLPKEFTLQGHGGVHSGWLGLQRTFTSIGYWYGFSAKKTFWEQKGSLTFSTNNPFTRGIKMIGSEMGPTFFATSESLFVNRSFRLSFEWRFGQMNADGGKKGKKITNDDSGR